MLGSPRGLRGSTTYCVSVYRVYSEDLITQFVFSAIVQCIRRSPYSIYVGSVCTPTLSLDLITNLSQRSRSRASSMTFPFLGWASNAASASSFLLSASPLVRTPAHNRWVEVEVGACAFVVRFSVR